MFSKVFAVYVTSISKASATFWGVIVSTIVMIPLESRKDRTSKRFGHGSFCSSFCARALVSLGFSSLASGCVSSGIGRGERWGA